jgi:hypothetical protein
MRCLSVFEMLVVGLNLVEAISVAVVFIVEQLSSTACCPAHRVSKPFDVENQTNVPEEKRSQRRRQTANGKRSTIKQTGKQASRKTANPLLANRLDLQTFRG